MGIARDIVALHGGTIDVHSVEGDGTRVVVRFPTHLTDRSSEGVP
jgi:signal transduction histidine kinase